MTDPFADCRELAWIQSHDLGRLDVPPDVLQALVIGAQHIRDATIAASRVANTQRKTVAFEFNRQTVIVKPEDDSEKIWRLWWEKEYGKTHEELMKDR
jgi:hypothetical protein